MHRIGAAAVAAWLAWAGPAWAQSEAAARWPDYQIIVWQHQSAARLAGLRRLGITGGAIIPPRTRLVPAEVAASVAPFAAAGLRPYVENVATDFYAPYHRWTPDHPVTWLFDEARRLHAADPADPRAFARTPSLSDPAALAAVHDRMIATVRAYAPARPLYYSLGDETGIADLSANWDFDLSLASLAAMRAWLGQLYGSLDTLNAEWGTHFAGWDDVRPMTTSDAMRQADDNFAAWSDFKAWMDEAFARAVRVGTVAVHEADPAALAAIEGAQVPGWGGYDYSRLAGAVDAMEIYPGHANMAVAHALNPDLVLLTTAFGGGAAEQHAIWQALLEGARGLVLWDEAGALVDDSGAPGPMAQALAPLFAELRGPAVARLLRATPDRDPVAILYSPASFRVGWMLDHRAEGNAWTRRDAEAELGDSPLRAAVRNATGLLAHMAIQPRWISSEGVEQGALDGDLRVLVLPQALALSNGEVAAIRRFVLRGGTVLADTAPGTFDGHGRRRGGPAPIAWERLDGATLSDQLARAGIASQYRVTRADGSAAPGVTLQSWRSDDATLVAVLSQPSNSQSEPLTLSWDTPSTTMDLRRGTVLGVVARATHTFDDPGPWLLALTKREAGPN